MYRQPTLVVKLLLRMKTEFEIKFEFPQKFQGEGGSCPDVTSMSPMSQCSSAVSNCWSVGEPDWDCPDNGLCCFDGCVNTCLGSSSPPPQQMTPEDDYDDYEDFEDDEAVVISAPAPDQKSNSDRSSNIGNGLLFPPPEVGYSLPDDEDDNGPPSPSSASSPQSSASSSSSNSPSSSPPASAAASPVQNVPRRPKPSDLPSSQTQVNLLSL